MISRKTLVFGLFAGALTLAGCRDLSHFDSRRDHYEGAIVSGSFVRAGLNGDARMCLTIDTSHLQDSPGAISTSDGRFTATPLRAIPQIWHDPLSTLDFGEGRDKNLVYVATPVHDGGATEGDVTIVMSLMQAGTIEVRAMRGAPGGPNGDADDLFGVFTLSRSEGACSF